ncbi:3-keto-5-aminohexanoate cleavage protein [Arenibacterium sp. LLYu02]|uniref:3-keto-5-aminohexanoate cleavage protein n=1 Tax=Arenibacterium sp. LLYu02 TaxID=3404132 RepID=UPI003B20C223
MQPRVILTCAVTGNLATREQHPGLPATPEEIANACLEASDAGAAIAHIHVRDPETAKPSMEFALYAEVVERIRAKNTSLILNLTTGPGGRYVPSEADPAVAGPGTTLLAPEKRVEHIVALKPEICTLDLNTMNSGGQVVINTPRNVRIMAEIIQGAGVKPEIELFDTGDIGLAADMLKDGSLTGPLMCSIVTGVKYGLPSTPDALATSARMLPAGSLWTGFGIGRMAFPMLVQSWLLGGHVRIGMEDTSYIARGQLTAGNGELTERARDLIEKLGGTLASPDEARALLGLKT